MESVLFLTFLSIAMFVGSYVAGMIPLAVTLSARTLRMVSVIGAGILVGTALAVIIPEGINTLYSTQMQSKPPDSGGSSHDHHHDAIANSNAQSNHQHSSSSSQEDIREAHSVIGVTLVLGFVFMLLVDQIGNSLSRSAIDAENGSNSRQDKSKITATLGLVVHAAADGIALGAAATTSHTDIEMIVFIAIMLHKAPAAFGLVTFLMHDGLDRLRIRRHLLIFSLAAPLTSLLTYFGISQSAKEALSSYNATGVAMLFSAGTFLYVATVHVLPEITSGGGGAGHSHHAPSSINGSESSQSLVGAGAGSAGGGAGVGHKGFTKLELFAIIAGCLLPVFLTVGHHH